MENSIETTSCEAKRTPGKINWGKKLAEESRYMFADDIAAENIQLKVQIEKPIIIKNPPQFLVDLIQNEIKRKKEREEEILSRKPDFEINLKDH